MRLVLRTTEHPANSWVNHVRVTAGALLALGLTVWSGLGISAVDGCPPLGPHGHRDYNDMSADARRKLNQINTTHLTSEVRSLQRGATTMYVGSELEFLLDIFPNHHEALEILIRLSFKERSAKPRGTKYSVDCYFEHAKEVAPNDGMVRVLYGVYLSRVGKKDLALPELLDAEKIRPNDGNVHYNLGLIYFDKKDYERAAEYAKKAYGLGFALPGLKEKLAGVGIQIGN